jgi:hypothetical protein
VLVSAVIGPKIEPKVQAAADQKSDPAAAPDTGAKPDPNEQSLANIPVLQRPGWRVRLAFFPADQNAEKPDYELGMLLLDNGVSRDMVIDYGDYTIKAKLNKIEALGKPHC